MSSESLEKLGLFFDELNRLRVWEPEAADRTNDLKDECKEFVKKITEFHKAAREFIGSVEELSKHVEREKIKALGSSNLLKSMAKQRETQQQQYQNTRIQVFNTTEGRLAPLGIVLILSILKVNF
ncbi:hypothetical protein RUM44_007918 [Polyplax serrata]|uniref:Uncharacterized protein n=1 Tax=Polyplax serrata TaxID=468196 RepID=A0ABR1BBQ0_POLSC